MNNIFKHALINALAAAAYVAAIGSFLFYAPSIFGEVKTVLVPIVMLSLFVLSAALMGVIIFGQPALWYLDGKKNEALSLLFSTLLVFLIITLAVISVLALSA